MTEMVTKNDSRSAADSSQIGQQLSTLATAVQSVESTRQLPVVAKQILAGLQGLVTFDVAVAAVGLSEIGPERATASQGLDSATAGELIAHLTNNGSLYGPGEDNPPILVSDWSAFWQQQGHKSMQQLVAREGLHSGALLPLTVGGETVGVVFFASRDVRDWPQNMQQVLQLFADAAASAIATATLYQDTQRSSNLAQQLLRISTAMHTGSDLQQIMERIAEAAANIYAAQCVWIEILDEEHSQFEQTYTYASDEDVAREVYLHGHDLAWSAVQREEMLHSNFLSADSQTRCNITAFPLRVDSEVVGVLTVARPTVQPPLGIERNTLQLLAAQAAVAIYNARLYQLAEQRSRRMEAAAAQAWEEEARARTLFEAAAAVTETTELPEILSKIAGNAAARIGFERVRIYLADHDKGVLCGATEAESDRAIVDISDQIYALRSGENMLVDAALSSAPYIIYSVSEKEDENQAEGESGRYERLFVPLRAHGTLVGIVVADNPRSQESISPQRTRLLRALAGMASVAIDRTQIDRLRELFISSVSHELRTPMASVQAYNELLLDEEAGPINEQQRVYLDRVDRACRRMRRIIDDLMSWSRLQAGEMSIDERVTDISECVNAVAEVLRPQATEAQVHLQVHLPEESLKVLTDGQRVEQIITNLVDNAIKFNKDNGRVDITVREEDQQVIIDVADTGPGIAAPLQGRIFEAFNRGVGDISRRTKGVGLGLTMASRMAEYLGGQIALASEPGVGSTFSLRLPGGDRDK